MTDFKNYLRGLVLFTLLIVFLIFTSCSKEEVVELDTMDIVESKGWFSKNLPGKTVVVVGSTLDDGAVVWINDKMVVLGEGEATGVYQLDNKIYITGWKYGGQGSVWRINIDGSELEHTILEGEYSEGQRITLHKGDIYVGGWFDNGSCYWKNGQKKNLTVNADSMSWDILFDDNGDQFNVGYYMKSHSLIPSYWKNGSRKTLSRPKHGDGEAKYIKSVNNKKFIGGTTSAPNNFLGYVTKPTYWVGGQRKISNIGSVDDGWQNSEVFDMFVDDQENVYLAGYAQNMEAEFPTYWKNGEKTQISEGSGIIRGLEVIDGEVIAVGTQSYFPGTPCVWIGNETYVYGEDIIGEVWDMLIIE